MLSTVGCRIAEVRRIAKTLNRLDCSVGRSRVVWGFLSLYTSVKADCLARDLQCRTEETKDAIVDSIGTTDGWGKSFCRIEGKFTRSTYGRFVRGEGTLHWIASFESVTTVFHIINTF